MSKEALRLALEALEDIGDEWGFTSQRTVPKRKEAITAIKEALANEALEKMAENARELGLDYEPAQKPWSPVSIGVDVTKEGAHVVGIYALDKDTSQIFYAKYHYAKDPQASQRKWVGLTDEEIWETVSRIGTSDSDVNPYAKLTDARAIEAKLKEKNT